jgi:crotonobetainyl-CoA:carnitine CoA-transferase CaiB-like acyl-CoA transferase
MKLGEVANVEATRFGKPLEGLRILALEHMQALPYATQLLARLGAEVVKVEMPGPGETGRASLPAILEPDGTSVGATFLRNNLGKKSITIDLKHPKARDLVLALVPHFDVVAQNFKADVLKRLGLAYEDVAATNPACIYVSVSGFGNDGRSPYTSWPALAVIVEAMSGIYEMRRPPDSAPAVGPMGAIGDISSALYATIGVLAAVLHRQRTGLGQHVDIAMLDAAVAVTDIVTNMWSLGLTDGEIGPVIMHGFRAADGWFVLQVIREHQFGQLARLVGQESWLDDPRFATREGWVAHLESDIRPAIEKWASSMTKATAARVLAESGLAAGPCLSAPEVVVDRHVAARHMLVEIPRRDGVEQPVLTPGNPVKMSRMAEGPEQRFPAVGEHTAAILGDILGLTADDVAALRSDGVI